MVEDSWFLVTVNTSYLYSVGENDNSERCNWYKLNRSIIINQSDFLCSSHSTSCSPEWQPFDNRAEFTKLFSHTTVHLCKTQSLSLRSDAFVDLGTSTCTIVIHWRWMTWLWRIFPFSIAVYGLTNSINNFNNSVSHLYLS